MGLVVIFSSEQEWNHGRRILLSPERPPPISSLQEPRPRPKLRFLPKRFHARGWQGTFRSEQKPKPRLQPKQLRARDW